MRTLTRLALLAPVAAVVALSGSLHTHHAKVSVPTKPSVIATAKSTCAIPSPSTAQGYTDMFANVPATYWSGADGALSVHMPSGLTVWLYSDTLSTANGFVHSSTIVQNKGCLHVSNVGQQLLPNESAKLIYWVDNAKAVSTTDLYVRGQQIAIGSANAWDFHSTGVYKTARVHVDSAHNASFVGWVGTETNGVATVTPYTKTIIQCAVRHNGIAIAYPTQEQLCPQLSYKPYSYNPQIHLWAQLTSGKKLLTVCFNASDALSHPEHYRPHFYEISV